MGRTEYIGETIEVYQGENNERVYCGHVDEAFALWRTAYGAV